MSITTHRVAILIGLLGAHPAYAQNPESNPLAAVTALRCVFSVYGVGRWQGGEPQVQTKAGVLTIRFDSIDALGGSAQSIGRLGVSDITARLVTGSLHLMYISNTGALEVTTVFSQETRDRKFKAVPAIHYYLPVAIPGFAAEPEVSQHYGECEIERSARE
jgi:hypothetical protein